MSEGVVLFFLEKGFELWWKEKVKVGRESVRRGSDRNVMPMVRGKKSFVCSILLSEVYINKTKQ